jgi:hypothetical protein
VDAHADSFTDLFTKRSRWLPIAAISHSHQFGTQSTRPWRLASLSLAVSMTLAVIIHA